MRDRGHGWFVKLGLSAAILLAVAIPCVAVERPFDRVGYELWKLPLTALER